MFEIKKIKVQNMISPKGNKIPNQFIITTAEGKYFQSYDSIIAFTPNKDVIAHSYNDHTLLDSNYWNYSKTTGKYRNQFLGEKSENTRAKINNGMYILTDLNDFSY